MKRCSISIPSNIAEGKKWSSSREFRRFLSIAYGSGTELETQIEIAKRLGYINDEDAEKTDSLINEVMKILNKLLSTIN